MDKKLQIVDRLYDSATGQPESRTNGQRPSEEDRREASLMAEAKFVMDHRPASRPDSTTIDAIVAFAAASRAVGDEPPVAATARILPMFNWRMAVAATFVLFVIGASYWKLYPTANDGLLDKERDQEVTGQVGRDLAETEEAKDLDSPVAAKADNSALADNATTGRTLPARRSAVAGAPAPADADDAGSRAGEPALAASGFAADPAVLDSIPGWEDPVDLRLLQRRIEMLRRSGADLDWGSPAVPLEQLPQTATTPGMRAVGAGNNNR